MSNGESIDQFLKADKLIEQQKNVDAYTQGCEAYSNKAECPYEIGNKHRCAWWCGWYDTFFNVKHKTIHETYGVTHG